MAMLNNQRVCELAAPSDTNSLQATWPTRLEPEHHTQKKELHPAGNPWEIHGKFTISMIFRAHYWRVSVSRNFATKYSVQTWSISPVQLKLRIASTSGGGAGGVAARVAARVSCSQWHCDQHLRLLKLEMLPSGTLTRDVGDFQGLC